MYDNHTTPKTPAGTGAFGTSRNLHVTQRVIYPSSRSPSCQAAAAYRNRIAGAIQRYAIHAKGGHP